MPYYSSYLLCRCRLYLGLYLAFHFFEALGYIMNIRLASVHTYTHTVNSMLDTPMDVRVDQIKRGLQIGIFASWNTRLDVVLFYKSKVHYVKEYVPIHLPEMRYNSGVLILNQKGIMEAVVYGSPAFIHSITISL